MIVCLGGPQCQLDGLALSDMPVTDFISNVGFDMHGSGCAAGFSQSTLSPTTMPQLRAGEKCSAGLEILDMELRLKRWLVAGYSVPYSSPTGRRDHMGLRARQLTSPLAVDVKARAVASGDFTDADLVGL